MNQKRILEGLLREVQSRLKALDESGFVTKPDAQRVDEYSDFIAEPKEPALEASDIEGRHEVISLTTCPETAKYMFNDEPTEKDIKMMNRWLAQHRNEYVRLYHGTSVRVPVKDEGLLRTNNRRKRSYQSQMGFVYLSVYPQTARTFGEMAYPQDAVVVYAVDVKIKELMPDKDQLRNKRLWGRDEHIGDTLADSLIIGHGARVKRDIRPYEIHETEY